MKKFALFIAAVAFLLLPVRAARAATGSDLINAVQTFVQTGLANVDSGFVPLRGAQINQSPGEHYQSKTTFGEFLPQCHISGYQPPQVPIREWVLSCSSPGLGANVNQLRGLIYQGVVRSLPVCFTRTLDPLLLRDELFRWDCNANDGGISVDVSTSPTSNGDPSFLLEVYQYVGVHHPQATPAPAPKAVAIRMIPPQPTVRMGTTDVPYEDYVTLNLAVNAAVATGSNGLVHVLQSRKGGNEMPPYDWAWHYVGKQAQNDTKNITVWICANLSPQEQIAALKSATLMGLLDSGFGGTALQNAYAAARDADAALGSQTSDPFLNRRKLIYAMAPFFQ